MKILCILKRNILTIVFLLFLLFLLIFSNNNIVAAKNGLMLWSTCIVPSLFPFFIATELLNYTNLAHIFGKIFSPIMRPFFNVPGEGAYAFMMGLISGCPIGAKIVCDLYDNGICTKNEAERMLAFTNNSGPLFIMGTVGILLFNNTTIGILLLLTHILSSITVGFILSYFSRHFTVVPKYQKNNQNKTPTMHAPQSVNHANLADLGSILGASIKKATSTVMLVGGFVVLFSVLLSILNRLEIISSISLALQYFHIPSNISQTLISGFIELTNGVNLSANLYSKCISQNIIICSFLLGFGGCSIMLQVLSIITKSGLSIKTYFYGKFLQGLIAAIYTFLIITNVSMFNFDISSSININVFNII